MRIFIKSKNFKITPQIKDYIGEKIGRLSKYESKILNTHIKITSGKEKHSDSKFRAEVTMHLPGKIFIRAEEAGSTPQAAIDLVSEDLERQVEKRMKKMGRLGIKEKDQQAITGSFPSEVEIEEIEEEEST